MRHTGIWIGGEEEASDSGAEFPVLNPATRETIGHAASGNASDIDRAVRTARRGFARWNVLSPGERERILLRAADIFESQGQARLLDILIDESGSTKTKAGYEIGYTPSLLRTAAGEVRRLYGDTFPNDRNDRMSMVIREPLGVVGVLAPYNAPLALLAKMVAFPLAAGNAVVVKPSEETPFIALEFAKMMLEAGLPAEALSLVTGFGPDVGAPLASHPDVDAIALTGATATGIAVGREAMRSLKRMQLELGGKNALVVLADYDPVAAAQIAADGIFTHAGQICMANSRVIVEAPIFDAFLAAFKAAAEALKFGDLRDPDTAYGPLINQKALDKVRAQQDMAVAAGARIVSGGEVLRGLVYAPTILVDTPRDTPAWREESFGPVANVVKAANFSDAIAIANDCDYGLSAGVLTHDLARGMQAARKIRAGSVHIGMHPFQSNAMAPIGGYKLSGLGKSGGRYSTEEFTELKWISLELGADL